MPTDSSSSTLLVIVILITLVNLAILTMYSLSSQKKINNLERMVKKLGLIVTNQQRQIDPKAKEAQTRLEAIQRLEEETRKAKEDLAKEFGSSLPDGMSIIEPDNNGNNSRKGKKVKAEKENDF